MRKVVLSAVVVVAALAAIPAASASASAVTCENNATIKLSPGLTTTATVQNVTIKGTLTNCVTAEGVEPAVKGGKYIAHLKSGEEGASCASLTGSAPATGTIVLKWGKGVGNSMGSLSLPISEGSTALSGLVESGAFATDPIGGAVNEAYTGGPTCGVVAEGSKKKAKKVNKGTLTGTLTIG